MKTIVRFLTACLLSVLVLLVSVPGAALAGSLPPMSPDQTSTVAKAKAATDESPTSANKTDIPTGSELDPQQVDDVIAGEQPQDLQAKVKEAKKLGKSAPDALGYRSVN